MIMNHDSSINVLSFFDALYEDLLFIIYTILDLVIFYWYDKLIQVLWKNFFKT